MTVFGALERFLGFLYRVYLSRSIGAEGLGIYQIALSVIGVLMTLSASGIPITVSRLMLKERANADRAGEADVISSGILTSLIISVPAVLALYLFKNALSPLFADERCYLVLEIMLPGVVITGVYAVIRGFFWGNRFYFTYAVIEFLEEAVMVAVGIIIVKKATNVFDGAKRAGISVFVSYVFSFVVSSVVFVLKSGRLTNPVRKLRPLIASSSPITAMRTLTSFFGSVIAVLLPQRLIRYGASAPAALAAFGEMSGMALPMIALPSTFIGSFALVVSPEISEAFYKGDKTKLRSEMERALKFSVVLSVLVIPVFIGCGKEIGEFVYSSATAGTYLAVSAITMLPMSVSMMTNSLLNSVNKERFTLVCYLASSAFTFLSIVFLPKYLGVYSLVAGYLAGYAVVGVINLIALDRFCEKKLPFKRTIFLSAASILPSATVSRLLTSILSKTLPHALVITISGGTAITFSALLLCVFSVVEPKKLFYLLSSLKRKKGKDANSRAERNGTLKNA